MGTRDNAANKDFSGIPLEEEEESHLKDAAVISMGTEISVEDMLNIEALCDQVTFASFLSWQAPNISNLRTHPEANAYTCMCIYLNAMFIYI